ncbi:MAG: c-type cytochrome [Campylobacteraceae bacterium]|jgi:cytochrome c oxidase cbb3-type subunit 3|nr:c-type cytochrome [Campylobacteraceae bacterium]
MSWLSEYYGYINLLAIAGAVATVVITAFVAAIYFKNIKSAKKSGELSSDSWDGIKEYKNPLPLGWAVSFLVLCIWAIWYMLAPAGLPFAYPLGAYSQIGEYNAEVAAYNEKFTAQWQNADEATLIDMGESVFIVQCAPCHGLDKSGIGGKAADLTVWGSKAAVVDSVVHGSKGMNYLLGEMAPMLGGLVSSEGEISLAVEYWSKYVSGTQDASNANEAEYNAWMVCASCHGEDGSGMDAAAPDLRNYGKSAFVTEVLNRGKDGYIGNMPSFNDGRLTDIQKQAVSAYVLSGKQ